MIIRPRLLALLLLPFGIGWAALASIPEPDAVIYGHVFIDGIAQVASDDVTIVARVDVPPLGNFPGAEDVSIGTYTLGEPAAGGEFGDDGGVFVLRARVESLADGSNRSPGAAIVGDRIHLCITKGVADETCAPTDTVTILDRGFIRLRHIGAAPDFGDWNNDTRVDLLDTPDFATCMKGPGERTSAQCTGVFDADGDFDVDQRDLQLLQMVFGGQS